MRVRPHFNPFLVREPEELPAWSKIFKGAKTLDLEIGFSTGRWLVGYAQLFPKRNIVGLEIRNQYIEHVREKIKELSLKNAYVLQANVSTSLNKLFKPGQLQDVFVMFPDPWYKSKHIKRRVITAAFIQDLYQYHKAGGKLHIATDQQALAQDMLREIESLPFYENTAGKNNYVAANIPELQTDIEIYNVKRDKPIYRLIFERKA